MSVCGSTRARSAQHKQLQKVISDADADAAVLLLLLFGGDGGGAASGGERRPLAALCARRRYNQHAISDRTPSATQWQPDSGSGSDSDSSSSSRRPTGCTNMRPRADEIINRIGACASVGVLSDQSSCDQLRTFPSHILCEHSHKYTTDAVTKKNEITIQHKLFNFH